MIDVIVIAHNIRSTHNVGSILRTSEAFGVTKVIFSGYSPYPTLPNDKRLPHIREKLNSQIKKSALGAETMVDIEYYETPPVEMLKKDCYKIVALEQDDKSIDITNYKAEGKIALILGEEVHGIESSLLSECDEIIEIPMKGRKESFNVSVATGIALYAITTSK